MQFLQDDSWVRTLGALGLLAMFLFLVYATWWALFSDRSAGRRRCPGCWYELQYSPGMTCPECGRVARTEQELRRRRRRPLIALLAIAGCTTIGLYSGDHVIAHGVLHVAPTWTLTASMPIVSGPRGAVFDEVERRIRAGEFTDRQWLALAERCARGDGRARPPSDDWIDRYERFTMMTLQRTARSRDPKWRTEAARRLRELPARVDVTSPRDWPMDVGPSLDVRVRTWWPRDTQCRIRTEATWPGATENVHVLRDAPIQERSYSITLPPLPEGRHEIDIAVEVQRRADATRPWQDARHQVVRVPVLVIGTFDDRMTAVSGDALNEFIGRVFRRGVRQFQGGGSLPVRVQVDYRQTDRPLFEDMAIGVRAEIFRNGTLGRQLDIWWRGGTSAHDREFAWEVPMHDQALLAAPHDDADTWSIRVESRPELALRVPDVDRYWEGTVHVGVPITVEDAAAPPRGWIGEGSATDDPP